MKRAQTEGRPLPSCPYDCLNINLFHRVQALASRPPLPEHTAAVDVHKTSFPANLRRSIRSLIANTLKLNRTRPDTSVKNLLEATSILL